MVRKRKCVLCKNGSRLFSFPENKPRKRRWAEALGLDIDTINDERDKVCAVHFTTDQFKYNSRKRLKDEACPSLVNIECDTSSSLEKRSNTSGEAESTSKALCYICGYVSRYSFFRFPKDVIRRAQWGEFCEISIDEIKPSFRLCNIHFTEDDFQNWSTKNILTRNSVPTQFPKYSFEERLECVEEIEEIDSTAPTLYDVEVDCQLEILDSAVASEVSLPVYTEQSTVVRSPSSVSASPKKHFRYFGDFDEDDVATPRRAKLALRMGKAALHKCRRKIATLEAEKSRLKTRILRLTDKILDLEKKDLLTQNTAQFV